MAELHLTPKIIGWSWIRTNTFYIACSTLTRLFTSTFTLIIIVFMFLMHLVLFTTILSKASCLILLVLPSHTSLLACLQDLACCSLPFQTWRQVNHGILDIGWYKKLTLENSGWSLWIQLPLGSSSSPLWQQCRLVSVDILSEREREWVIVTHSDSHDIHHQPYGIKTNFSQPYFTFWDTLLGTRFTKKREAKKVEDKETKKN